MIDYAATLKLAFPQNNNDGIAYSFQRGLSGTARYLSLKSGTISNGSTATTQLNGSLVELQSGELVYLTVGNKGNYYWDHTIATMSISLTSPPTSSVVGADTVVTFSSVGSRTWTVPAGVSSVRYLVVGGGGGGGSDNGGGGGAGGYLAGLSLATTPGDSKLVVVGDGGAGAVDLAHAVVAACDEPNNFHFLYEESASLKDKISAVATKIYGASDVEYSDLANEQLARYDANGFSHLPVCIAKTHLSISGDPTLKGAPSGHTLVVREVRASVGAGFIYPIVGNMRTMPGLGADPAALHIDIGPDGRIVGLF